MPLLSKRERPDARGRETEQAFLDATRDLLEEGASFAELNVSRIAERAQRTRTSFYAYFTDRRALLTRMTDPLAADLFEITAGFFSGPVEPPDIRRALRQILDIFSAHTTVIRTVVEASGYDDEVATQWRATIDPLIEGAQRRIEQLREVSADEARALAFSLVWMVERSFYQHCVRGSGIDEQHLLDGLTGIVSRAIAPA